TRLAAAGGLSKTALVSDGSAAAGTGNGGPARLEEPSPNELRLEAASGIGPGMLVVLDNYAPGWRATDLRTGQSLPLHQVDLTFRGVPLPARTRSVRLRYEPTSFRMGLFLAALAIGILVALAVGGRERGGAGTAPS